MTRKIISRRSPIHGNGVFAAQDLAADKALIRYRGRLLRHADADGLYEGGADSGHTFLFTLNEHYVVDGNNGGNTARWINHSCTPNCVAYLVEHPSGDPARDRIVIDSLHDIQAGEELTYDYGIRLAERHTARMKKIWACRCGAPDCTGTMLKSKK
ncbi:MAG: SET domain-containing protein [Stenotrophobium sp.]